MRSPPAATQSERCHKLGGLPDAVGFLGQLERMDTSADDIDPQQLLTQIVPHRAFADDVAACQNPLDLSHPSALQSVSTSTSTYITAFVN